ncbi:fluoride efflux transporter FluC [Paenarthrobacter nicotinovorans]|uniref:fluoride efflux transporter FluC n=1 Tax=Paenarthrobacter nicotinovorans TaxID=29320 RepID=UPI00381BF207
MTATPPIHAGAVFVGGLLGTGFRWGLDTLIPHNPDQWPLSTLIINVTGSFILAYLVARTWHRPMPSWFQAGAGAGALGTFTTFSAVAAALVTLTIAGEELLAVLYLVATLVLGLGAAVAGVALGNHLHASPVWPEEDE